MTLKIPSRGSVVVTLPQGGTLDLWYDKETRLWVLQRKDTEGNQIGPGHDGTADYAHNREDLVDTMLALLKEQWVAVEARTAHQKRVIELREQMLAVTEATQRAEVAIDAYFRPLVVAAIQKGDLEGAQQIITGECPDSVTRVFLMDTLRQARLLSDHRKVKS
jgi:hypothetical protein